MGGGGAVGFGGVAVLEFLLLVAEFVGVGGAVAEACQDIGVLVAEAAVVVGGAGVELDFCGGEAGVKDVLSLTIARSLSTRARACRALSGSKTGSSQDESSSETHLD